MCTENNEFFRQLKEADMVLIGLGEEFNRVKKLRENKEYSQCRDAIESASMAWMIPKLNMLYEPEKEDIAGVLQRFADLIAEKNYFVISVSTNELIRQTSWREKRLVMPCGGSSIKQCINKCDGALVPVSDDDRNQMEQYRNKMITKSELEELDLGKCPICGSAMVLNNIYTEKYDENGYLEQWQLYTKWLQGTLNKKLLVLELGVGMQCPSVIRWPFEKVAYFNQKALFWRVNETLYQLSEEIKEKGTSISKNAIDWLRDLC